jgi:hypothetical protein
LRSRRVIAQLRFRVMSADRARSDRGDGLDAGPEVRCGRRRALGHRPRRLITRERDGNFHRATRRFPGGREWGCATKHSHECTGSVDAMHAVRVNHGIIPEVASQFRGGGAVAELSGENLQRPIELRKRGLRTRKPSKGQILLNPIRREAYDTWRSSFTPPVREILNACSYPFFALGGSHVSCQAAARLHTDRTSGCHRNHRHSHCLAAARGAAGARGRPADAVPQPPQAVRVGAAQLPRQLQPFPGPPVRHDRRNVRDCQSVPQLAADYGVHRLAPVHGPGADV